MVISPKQCSQCAINKVGKTNGIFRAKSEGRCYKKSSISAHLFSFHTPKSAKIQGSKKRKADTINFNQLSLNGKLSDQVKQDILQAKIDLCAETGISLNSLTNPVFMTYERILWKHSNHNIADFDSIPNSRRKF